MKVKKEDVDAMRAEWDRPIKIDDTDGSAPEAPATPHPNTPMVHYDSQIVANNNQASVPSAEWTGVDESITQICANLSNQIYDAKSKDYFKLESGSVTAEVIIFDDHGELNATIPAFAVAATQDTLIMGWRGTSEVMDIITDAALAPVFSSELGKAATGIRSHSMFSGFVGSDLKIHQDAVISYIKKHRITNIVFTGHSMGGGLANVAHLFVQAQTGGYNENSVWNGLGRLTLRTVSFAAVMAILDRDEVEFDNKPVDNEYSDKLLEEVGKNTSNFVCTSDVVPRGYSYVSYANAFVEAAAPEAIRSANPFWFGLGTGRITESVLNFLREGAKPLIPTAIKYRHPGKLLYYASTEDTEPVTLTDTGPAMGSPSSKDKSHLNHYTYKSYNIRRGQHIDTLLSSHSHFPTVLASYISVDKEEEK